VYNLDGGNCDCGSVDNSSLGQTSSVAPDGGSSSDERLVAAGSGCCCCGCRGCPGCCGCLSNPDDDDHYFFQFPTTPFSLLPRNMYVEFIIVILKASSYPLL